MSIPSTPDNSGRLRGLSWRRVLGMVMAPAEPAVSGAIPTAEELGALLPEYEVQAVIGRGGMGAVYRAVQRKLARSVAIKVLPVDLGDAPGFADRFRLEAMTTAGLTHPDIVAVHDTGETVAGHLFYVMDLVDGEDLALRMARGRLPLEESLAVLTTVCGAVEAAHERGIIHRDIKPSNILLTKEGKPKLADFGLALLTERHLEYSRLTLGGTTLGTLEYAAPEQLAGTGAMPASDQYSLGVLAYELLTGELPRGVFDPPSARNAEIDAAFDGVVLRALQSDPARRYDSVAEFRRAILHAADRRAQQAKRDAAARLQLHRRTRVAGAAAGIALFTVGLAVFAWKQSQRAEAGEAEANKRRATSEAAEKETESVIQFLLTDLRKRLEQTGNLAAMESVLERAVGHFRTKHEAAAHSPDTGSQLADVLVVKADVVGARGMREAALALYGEALELVRAARDSRPPHAAATRRVATALQDRSEFCVTIGRFPGALEDARLMLGEARKAGALENSVASRQLLAAAHRAQADALGYLLDFDACGREYLAAQVIFKELAADQTDNPLWPQELAALEMSLGSLAEARKNYPLMLQHFTAYHDFVKRTQGTDSNIYSHSAVRLAHALVLNKRPDEAFPLLSDAIRIAEADLEAKPGHLGYRGHLRWCLVVFAKMQEQRGEGASAAETGRRIATLDATMAATPQEDAAVLQDAVAVRLGKAEQECFEALQQNPENDGAQYAWAMASEEVGKDAEAKGGIPAAEEHYAQQLAKLEPLLVAAPPATWWNLGASYTLNRLGVLKEQSRKWTAAEPIFRRSLALRRRTLATHPGNPRDCRNVASTAARLARSLIGLQRPAGADALWRELLAELKPIPRDAGFEWRALVASSIPETMAALELDAARSLAAVARDFLLAPGEAGLSAAEKESLAALGK